MNNRCEYACNHYGVPADIGRIVSIDGRPGVIAEDRGAYIGVLFDDLAPNEIRPCHPTWMAEYGDMGALRKMTRSQERYQKYHDSDWFDGTFAEWMGFS